jgi:hypothetical protein
MIATPQILFRGAATTTTSTTLYTVPADTTAVVTSIIVTNTASSAGTFTISLNDVLMADAVSVAAKDSVILDIRQVLAATNTIKGGASATTINFHIGGVELA